MKTTLKHKLAGAETALFAAALFWGLSLVFQRQALAHMSPIAYHCLRFGLGGLLLLPVAVPRLKRQLAASPDRRAEARRCLRASLAAGSLMCAGSGLQQYALAYTTVAKVGFITNLYVVLVPLLLFLAGRRIGMGELLGTALALIGLFLLSVTDTLTLSAGDILVVIGAFVWAGHVLCLSAVSPGMDPFVLGTGQALVSGLYGLAGMLWQGETPSAGALAGAWHLVLFGAFLSVTLGYTLQIYGQKRAGAITAAIILQLEAVFATAISWLFLSETMTPRMIAGAAVMFAGVFVVQIWPARAAPGREDEKRRGQVRAPE